MEIPTEPESLCDGGPLQDEKQASALALLKDPQITMTPEPISRLVDDFLRERGPFDFGRGFDMKSTLTEIVSELLAATSNDITYELIYPQNKMVALVLWFLGLLFPSIETMNEFAAKISRCSPIKVDIEKIVGHPNLPGSPFYYKHTTAKKNFRSLQEGWKRHARFLKLINLSGRLQETDSALALVVAELLAIDLWMSSCAMGHSGVISDDAVSKYISLGISYLEVEPYDEHFHCKFKLLRDDLNELCAENYSHFQSNIKATLKAAEIKHRDREYWNRQYWEDTTAASQADTDTLRELKESLQPEKCVDLWFKRRTACWQKLSSSFYNLLDWTDNSGALSQDFGKGIIFLIMSTGISGGFRDVDEELFRQLCIAFKNKIPEVRMITDEIESSINIPGLDLDLEGDLRKTAANPDNLKEGMEHVRGFYERLMKGELRPTDLTPFSGPLHPHLTISVESIQ